MSCQRSNGEEATHIKDLKSDNLPLDKALDYASREIKASETKKLEM